MKMFRVTDAVHETRLCGPVGEASIGQLKSLLQDDEEILEVWDSLNAGGMTSYVRRVYRVTRIV